MSLTSWFVPRLSLPGRVTARRHAAAPLVLAGLLNLAGGGMMWSLARPAEAAAGQPAAALLGHEAFDSAVRAAVDPSVAAALASLKVLHLSGDLGPWLDTGVALAPGQAVTLLMNGRLHWSRAAGLGLSPQLAVWGQVGPQGTVFNGSRDAHGFIADSAGPLRLKLFPGLGWTDRQGHYLGDPAPVQPDAGGGISVAVLAWRPGTDVAAQLRTLARQPALAAQVQSELQRWTQGPRPVPAGWELMWQLGQSEIFSRSAAAADDPAGPLIEVHTLDDVGILQKDAPFEFRPGTRLNWRWRIDQLPSERPENTLPTHDYLSVAVAFDNGRDLTFLWSHSLPVGAHFHCPLPAWQDRETHWVQRSGTTDLGRWHAESVDLYAAYQQAIGGPLPGRITRVWLIANSVFQKREGRGRFAGIELTHGAQRLTVP